MLKKTKQFYPGKYCHPWQYFVFLSRTVDLIIQEESVAPNSKWFTVKRSRCSFLNLPSMWSHHNVTKLKFLYIFYVNLWHQGIDSTHRCYIAFSKSINTTWSPPRHLITCAKCTACVTIHLCSDYVCGNKWYSGSEWTLGENQQNSTKDACLKPIISLAFIRASSHHQLPKISSLNLSLSSHWLRSTTLSCELRALMPTLTNHSAFVFVDNDWALSVS